MAYTSGNKCTKNCKRTGTS